MLNAREVANQNPAAKIDLEALSLAADGDMSVPTLFAEADRLAKAGRADDVISLYRTWIAHNSAHPSAYAARFNFAVVLAESGAFAQSRDMLRSAIALKPDFAQAHINLGTVLEKAGDRLGAVATWQNLAAHLAEITGDRIHFKATALNQSARVLEGAKLEKSAEDAMRASLDVDPDQPEVIQHHIALRQAQCAWPVLCDLPRLPARSQLEVISPLSLAAQFDDPVFQLANAHRYAQRDAFPQGISVIGQWPQPDRLPLRRLRIGYVSSDMREHAVGFLTAELFALHDRTKFEIYAYYCGPARADSLKQQFQKTADCWRDIATMTDKEAAACIVADEIDILIDLNLYTRDGRIKLFAYKPAPIIVNWLGFPGSAGSSHHHYIIADKTIIPHEDEVFYSERVLRLPCYQPNNRFRAVSHATPSREEAGLPDQGFIYCSFNGPHKIVPEVFTAWMSILNAVPGSILWLLSSEEDTMARLRHSAASAGVAPDRLIFAPRLGNAEHLARYRLADLFLDTAPYGAHTTASDALWMGLPVLTRAGNCFAARVCASLVRASGLPNDYICTDLDTYVERAIFLGSNPTSVCDARHLLSAHKHTSVLFDTPGLVKSLESLFERMWHDYSSGELPQPILRHLPLYHRLGCERLQGSAVPTRSDLLDFYHRALRFEAASHPLQADPLLWQGSSALSAPLLRAA